MRVSLSYSLIPGNHIFTDIVMVEWFFFNSILYDFHCEECVGSRFLIEDDRDAERKCKIV